MIYKLDIKVSFWEGFMAEYSEAVLTIAKRKLMKDFLVSDVDRIVHDEVALAAIQGLSNEQRIDFFERQFNDYINTDEGKAKLEETISGIDEGAYYERTSDEIAEEELRDQWDIARLQNYTVDHRLNPNNRSTQSPADVFDHSIYKEPDEEKRAFYIDNVERQYENYRNEWNGGVAEFKKLKAEIESRAASYDADVDGFISEHKPFKDRARNRAIIWTALGVAGLAIGIFTIPVAVSILGSAAAATGALAVGVPAIGFGGAFSALGVSNIVKYVRYSSLFRNLKRVVTRTDSKGVSLTREMLNKSLTKIHKMANKLGIAKSELPSAPIISGYVDDYKPLRIRLAGAVKAAATKTKTAVQYTVAPTEEQKQVKAAKSTLRKAKQEVKTAKRSSDQAEKRLRTSDESIANMERRVAARKEASARLQKEAEEKSIAAGFAEFRHEAEVSNLDAAKRNSGKKNTISMLLSKNVRKARKDSVKAQREYVEAQIEANDAHKAVERNKLDIEAGEKRLESLRKNNPRYVEDSVVKKTNLDVARLKEEEAQIELKKALKKTK